LKALSHKFDPEFWNYAKLISSTLRYGMPIEKAVDLTNSLQLDNESINTWKNGVARALKTLYVQMVPKPKGQKCSNCNSTNLIYQEGCLTCQDCGSSKCG
jgi:ribonucleoside-diphosphate reductase alpha chain